MTAPPTVSIVMPCFNARPHLSASVGSVLAQSSADWEIVAVDDGSQDGTLEWLQAQTDPRIRWITQTNQGVSAARNAGIALARGQFLAFLDADDTWSPEFLQRMLQGLEERPDAVLAYCGWQNIGLAGGKGEPYVPPDHETADKQKRLFAACLWPIHGALVRRKAVVNAGGFNPALKNAEDYALWLTVAAHAPIVRVPAVLAFYHFHGGAQASTHKARAALHFLQAQIAYLATHPEFARALERGTARTLTLGTLLRRGYDCYWSNELAESRVIFRAVMKHGYGTRGDWLYMLPALLPLRWHRRVIDMLRSRRNNDG